MPLVFFTFSRVLRLTGLTTLDRYVPSGTARRPPGRNATTARSVGCAPFPSGLTLAYVGLYHRLNTCATTARSVGCAPFPSGLTLASVGLYHRLNTCATKAL
eukprot:702702-Pyramimonas_sp.AAC.2